MDGMFLQTGRVFEPIRYGDGEIIAFLEKQPERTRAKDLDAASADCILKAQERYEAKHTEKPPSLRAQLRKVQKARPLPVDHSHPEKER